jgi:hypothetical protein
MSTTYGFDLKISWGGVTKDPREGDITVSEYFFIDGGNAQFETRETAFESWEEADVFLRKGYGIAVLESGKNRRCATGLPVGTDDSDSNVREPERRVWPTGEPMTADA